MHQTILENATVPASGYWKYVVELPVSCLSWSVLRTVQRSKMLTLALVRSSFKQNVKWDRDWEDRWSVQRWMQDGLMFYDEWELSYNAALDETSRCLRWDFGKVASWPWNCNWRSSIQLRSGSTNSFCSFTQFSNCSQSLNSSSIASTVRARTMHRLLLTFIS